MRRSGRRIGLSSSLYRIDFIDASRASFGATALNQYTVANNQGTGYDNNFNLTSYNGVSFSYDAQDQLIGGSMEATYDGLGRCVRRTVNGNTTLYVYDEWKPELEFDQWNNMTAWMVYGSGADEILFRCSNAGGCTYYKQDAHGNVVATLDPGGNIIEKYTYDAFGKPKITGWWDDNERGSSWYGNRFMFSGERILPRAGHL